jgi:hypothetical protein
MARERRPARSNQNSNYSGWNKEKINPDNAADQGLLQPHITSNMIEILDNPEARATMVMKNHKATLTDTNEIMEAQASISTSDPQISIFKMPTKDLRDAPSSQGEPSIQASPLSLSNAISFSEVDSKVSQSQVKSPRDPHQGGVTTQSPIQNESSDSLHGSDGSSRPQQEGAVAQYQADSSKSGMGNAFAQTKSKEMEITGTKRKYDGALNSTMMADEEGDILMNSSVSLHSRVLERTADKSFRMTALLPRTDKLNVLVFTALKATPCKFSSDEAWLSLSDCRSLPENSQHMLRQTMRRSLMTV